MAVARVYGAREVVRMDIRLIDCFRAGGWKVRVGRKGERRSMIRRRYPINRFARVGIAEAGG